MDENEKIGQHLDALAAQANAGGNGKKTRSSELGAVKVQHEWFRRKIEETQTSQNDLARSLGMDNAALSKLINGGQIWKAKNVCDFARALSVSVEEILLRIGIPAPPVVGQGAGRRGPTETETTVKWSGRKDDCWLAGATVITADGGTGISPDSVGRLSVAVGADGGRTVGVVKKDRASGKWVCYDIISKPGDVLASDVVSAAPVVSIRLE